MFAAAQQQQPAAPTAAPAPARWSRTPSTATVDVIDYTTKLGQSLFYKATAALDSDNKFDCTPDGLRDFLGQVNSRATESGWTETVMAIQEDPTDPLSPTSDFIKNYGTFELDLLRDVAATYHPAQSRANQDSYNLYRCLYQSLSQIGRDKVTLREDEYKIGDEEVGILFLKIIISTSSIDTNATVSSIRNQLNNLDIYIKKVDFDIAKFNMHVQQLVQRLAARKQTTHDLLTNLFKAYKTVPDKEFNRYIAQKESDYEEENVDMSPESLMSKAKTRFEILQDKQVWKAPSAEEEKIVALEAKLKRQQQNGKGKSDKDKGKNKKGSKKDRRGGGKDKDGKRKNGDNDSSWKDVAPKPGEPTTKTINDVKWYFCTKHKRWGHHATVDCEGKGINKENKGDKSPGTGGANQQASPKTGRNPRLIKAQKATVRFSDLIEDSDSDSE